ncbi:MAG: RDD family protein [bacterium]
MALNWEEDEEELTVAEISKEELRQRPTAPAGDVTVPFARKSDLQSSRRRVSWEEQTPLPTRSSPFAQRFPLHAALPRDRFAAFFIDTMILAYINLGIGRLFKHFLFSEPWFAASFGRWQLALRIVAIIIAGLTYYVFFEAVGGATPGKLLCRLRVVDLEGSVPTLTNVFLRNLCRLFDYPLLFFVALLSMESSHFYQRLGDRAAHTVVIKKTRKRLVPIDLRATPLSSTFARMVAFGIDLVLYAGFLWLYLSAMNPAKVGAFQCFFWLFPFFAYCYFMIFEFATSTTPGKLLLKRQVVLENGEPLDATAAIVRNMVLPLDLVLGYPLLALTRRKQRLGDLLADTLVIKRKPDRNGAISVASLFMVLFALGYLASHNPQKNWFKKGWQSSVKTAPGVPAKPVSAPAAAPSMPTSPSPSSPNLSEPSSPAAPQTPPAAVTATPSKVPAPPKPQSTNSTSLRVTEFYFSAGPDPTQIRSDGVFHRGDFIFLFFKLAGFEKQGGGKINVSENLQLTGPNGDLMAEKNGLVNYTQAIPEGSQQMLFANQLTLPNDSPPGAYNLVLTLKDGTSGEQLVYEKSFILQ